jgi:hypothetical protein
MTNPESAVTQLVLDHLNTLSVRDMLRALIRDSGNDLIQVACSLNAIATESGYEVKVFKVAEQVFPAPPLPFDSSDEP